MSASTLQTAARFQLIVARVQELTGRQTNDSKHLDFSSDLDSCTRTSTPAGGSNAAVRCWSLCLKSFLMANKTGNGLSMPVCSRSSAWVLATFSKSLFALSLGKAALSRPGSPLLAPAAGQASTRGSMTATGMSQRMVWVDLEVSHVVGTVVIATRH